jgi:hypothetical protein
MLGIGAGIGAAVDASLHRHTTVYLRPATRSALQWSPTGVRLSFQF